MAIRAKKGEQAAAGKEKTVVSCNFRSAGRISNELARALSAVHENYARNLAGALDALLGRAPDVKLSALDQLQFQEHIATIPPFSCIVPFSLQSNAGVVLVECNVELVFPLIDLLLGGDGSMASAPRELSEIEDEIVQELFSLVVNQAETAWGLPVGSLTAGQRLRAGMLDRVCSMTEKVTCVKFTLQMGTTVGALQLVLPAAVLDMLLQQIKQEQPRKRSALRPFPQQGIRDRILDSDVEVAVELPSLRIAVKDLLTLLPGSVVKLRASVRTPGMLVAGGRGIFEATPVRNGARKAAQLGRRIASPNLEEV